MKKSALLTALFLSVVLCRPSPSSDSHKGPSFFQYQEFLAVRNLDPEMEEARLCGMNKICVRMWKNGQMLLPEHGLVVRADFDGDGTEDIAIAMEKDRPQPEGLEIGPEYFMMVAAKTPSGLKLLQTIKFAHARSFIEAYWQPTKHRMAVDLGERQINYGATMTMYDGTIINVDRKKGVPEAVLTYLTWNKHEQKFDMQHGEPQAL